MCPCVGLLLPGRKKVSVCVFITSFRSRCPRRSRERLESTKKLSDDRRMKFDSFRWNDRNISWIHKSYFKAVAPIQRPRWRIASFLCADVIRSRSIFAPAWVAFDSTHNSWTFPWTDDASSATIYSWKSAWNEFSLEFNGFSETRRCFASRELIICSSRTSRSITTCEGKIFKQQNWFLFA